MLCRQFNAFKETRRLRKKKKRPCLINIIFSGVMLHIFLDYISIMLNM